MDNQAIDGLLRIVNKNDWFVNAQGVTGFGILVFPIVHAAGFAGIGYALSVEESPNPGLDQVVLLEAA